MVRVGWQTKNYNIPKDSQSGNFLTPLSTCGRGSTLETLSFHSVCVCVCVCDIVQQGQ